MLARPSLSRLALALSLLLGAGAFGCQYLPFGHSAKAAEKTEPTGPARVLKLESTTLNLADPAATFLRVGVSLGLDSTANPETDARLQSVARDAIVTQASASLAADLLTSAGKDKLKLNLLHALQKAAPQADVKAIYFDEFLIQR